MTKDVVKNYDTAFAALQTSYNPRAKLHVACSVWPGFS